MEKATKQFFFLQKGSTIDLIKCAWNQAIYLYLSLELRFRLFSIRTLRAEKKSPKCRCFQSQLKCALRNSISRSEGFICSIEQCWWSRIRRRWWLEWVGAGVYIADQLWVRPVAGDRQSVSVSGMWPGVPVTYEETDRDLASFRRCSLFLTKITKAVWRWKTRHSACREFIFTNKGR